MLPPELIAKGAFATTAGGDVGIGTATPQARLHVSGGPVLIEKDLTVTDLTARTAEAATISVTEKLSVQPPPQTLSQAPIAEFAAVKITGDAKVIADSFIGDGTRLTGFSASARVNALDAANISSGILSADHLPPHITKDTEFVRRATFNSAVKIAPMRFPAMGASGYYFSCSPADSGTDPAGPFMSQANFKTRAEYRPEYANRFGIVRTPTDAGDLDGHWIQMRAPTPFILQSYKVTSDATEWALLGSHDAMNWTLLHRASEPALHTASMYVYANTPYAYYRLVFLKGPALTAGVSYTRVTCDRIDLYGSTTRLPELYIDAPVTIANLNPGILCVGQDGRLVSVEFDKICAHFRE